MIYIAAALLCLPLVASSISKAWDVVWGDRESSVLPARVSDLLSVVQFLVAAAVVLLASPLALGLLAALYGVMGLAVAWLRARRGRADCGCWGRARKGRLGYGLAAGDLGLGALALAAAFALSDAPEPAVRVLVLGTMIIICVQFMLIVPAFLPAYRRYRELADRYRPWASGFPELKPLEVVQR